MHDDVRACSLGYDRGRGADLLRRLRGDIIANVFFATSPHAQCHTTTSTAFFSPPDSNYRMTNVQSYYLPDLLMILLARHCQYPGCLPPSCACLFKSFLSCVWQISRMVSMQLRERHQALAHPEPMPLSRTRFHSGVRLHANSR